jgi:hypothetical protein
MEREDGERFIDYLDKTEASTKKEHGIESRAGTPCKIGIGGVKSEKVEIAN